MKRSKFSLSHYKLFTCDMGQLVPMALTEVLPGDSIQQSTSALIRVSPLVAPVMHPVNVRIHHWFVPTRLIWEDFEKFITGGPDGMDASILPIRDMTPAEGSLADYLGLPVGVALNNVSMLPFRAYNKIWNEFYRDQDLQTELVNSEASGSDLTTNTDLQNVCWEKDYFTTSRPWTQKGDEVVLPLGTVAPVETDGTTPSMQDGTNTRLIVGQSSGQAIQGNAAWAAGPQELKFVNSGLQADLSGATAATILQLREAFALQRYAEARARYGSRYTEYLRYLGVRSSDARQDRPEYLGGGKQTIQFSEVLQTGPDTDDTGVGNLKGHGIGALRSNRYRRFFEEHGYIVSLMSVMPKTIYCQGISKLWTRATKEDFFQRELQHIGQAEVLNKELYAAHSTPDGVFGYQDRYDEYRRSESGVAGEFRSTLDEWHMARIFASDPALNSSFVTANPTKRSLASTNTDALYVMANHSIQARRMVAGR